MTGQNNLKCFLGLHQYEVYKEEDLYNVYKVLVGKVIISRCKHCGKIIYKHIYTIEKY